MRNLIYILILGVIGFVGLVALAVYYKKLETTMEDKLEDLEKEIQMIEIFALILAASTIMLLVYISKHDSTTWKA